MTPELFDDICRSSLGHRTSQEQTYDLARNTLARGVAGDFVECGVFAGASSALMAHAILDQFGGFHPGMPIRVHLFDSFEGIPMPGPHDDPSQVKAGAAACSLEDCKRNLIERWHVPEGLLVWHKGWFKFTVPESVNPVNATNIKEIALLRLDGDLYESTALPMEYLFPLVAKGGYVICDDYDLIGCRYALQEVVMPAPVAFRKWW